MTHLRALPLLLVLALGASCGVSPEESAADPTSAPPPTAPRAVGPVVLGSPVDGRWVPVTFDCDGVTWPSPCSLPRFHHWLDAAVAPLGDWSTDLGAAAGSEVTLEIAGDDAPPVAATVQAVQPACGGGRGASRAERLRAGGWAVTVALTADGVPLGTVTVAHLRTSLDVGDAVATDGGPLGRVGAYLPGGCWTGPHVHLQTTSAAGHACWLRALRPGQELRRGTPIGLTGNGPVQRIRQPCPPGATDSSG